MTSNRAQRHAFLLAGFGPTDGGTALSGAQYLAVAIAAIAFALFTIEERLTVKKTPVALVAGVGLWLLAAATGDGDHAHLLSETNAEILEIFLFLFSAMVLVEGLERLRFFDLVRSRMLGLGLGDRQQFIAIALLAFGLSALLDNMTATIVMVEFSRRFFQGGNLLVAAAAIVVFANAGGAWSPIGDVTTIMLWVQAKFTTAEIVLHTLLPSLVHASVAGALLYRKLEQAGTGDEVEEQPLHFTRADRLLMGVTLASFTLPVVVRQAFGLSPYLGLLLGLGIVWALMDHLRHAAVARDRDAEDGPGGTALQRDIISLLRRVDQRSLLFFVGILLVVSALQANGVLARFSDRLLGEDPSSGRIVLGAVVLGYASAIVDNVPLTALAMNVLTTANGWHWTLLAYTVGTGGSHLILGSVAGVIAMGKIEGLTTAAYVRIAFVPVFLAYLAGLAVWLLEFWLFG